MTTKEKNIGFFLLLDIMNKNQTDIDNAIENEKYNVAQCLIDSNKRLLDLQKDYI